MRFWMQKPSIFKENLRFFLKRFTKIPKNPTCRGSRVFGKKKGIMGGGTHGKTHVSSPQNKRVPFSISHDAFLIILTRTNKILPSLSVAICALLTLF